MIIIAALFLGVINPVFAQQAISCDKSGTVAWQNDNQISGEAYGEAPVGGLDEACWVVGQTWWEDSDGTPHRATFAVRPHTVAWLSGHRGGTGWYYNGSEAEARANIVDQERQLKERDGEMSNVQVILPDEMNKIPIVTRTSQKAGSQITTSGTPAPTTQPAPSGAGVQPTVDPQIVALQQQINDLKSNKGTDSVSSFFAGIKAPELGGKWDQVLPILAVVIALITLFLGYTWRSGGWNRVGGLVVAGILIWLAIVLGFWGWVVLLAIDIAVYVDRRNHFVRNIFRPRTATRTKRTSSVVADARHEARSAAAKKGAKTKAANKAAATTP